MKRLRQAPFLAAKTREIQMMVLPVGRQVLQTFRKRALDMTAVLKLTFDKVVEL